MAAHHNFTAGTSCGDYNLELDDCDLVMHASTPSYTSSTVLNVANSKGVTFVQL